MLTNIISTYIHEVVLDLLLFIHNCKTWYFVYTHTHITTM